MIALITNDDGIEARGLQVLRAEISNRFPDAEIYTVAPRQPMSQVGHRVTTDRPIPFERREEREWAVEGTPADCVRAALFSLIGKPVDWVFSGINHGGNLGQDIFISGTLAAAREAAYHGVPAVGLSHYLRKDLELDWERAAGWVGEAVSQIRQEPHEDGHYWNVNLPHLARSEPEPSLVQARPERGALPVAFQENDGELSYHGVYAERPREEGTDVAVCFGGHVSVTRLQIHR